MTVTVASSGSATNATGTVTGSISLTAAQVAVVVAAPDLFSSGTWTSDGTVTQQVANPVYQAVTVNGPATYVTFTSGTPGFRADLLWIVASSDLGRTVTAGTIISGFNNPFPGTDATIPNASGTAGSNVLLVAVASAEATSSVVPTTPSGMTLQQSTSVPYALGGGIYCNAGIATEALTTGGSVTRNWTSASARNWVAGLVQLSDPAASWVAPTVIPDPCFEFTYRWPNLYEDLLSGDADKVQHAIERLEERDRELEQKIKDCCCGGGGGGGD